MKFLVVGDPHISDKQISTRLDNYPETCLKKLIQIKDYCFSNSSIEKVIFLGDIFSNPITNKKFFNQIMDIFSQFRSEQCYFITGNHSGDIEGKYPFSYKEKDLGVLEKSKLLTRLDENIYSFKGISAYQDFNPELKKTALSYNPKIEYLFCHHFISTGWDDLILDPLNLSITFPNLKMVFAGHDHTMKNFKSNGIDFFLPGSMMRTSAADQRDKVSVLEISISPDIPYIKEIYLETTSYHETFIENSKLKKVKSASASQVSEFVTNVSEISSIQLDNIIEYVVKKYEKMQESLEKEEIKNHLQNINFLI